MRTKHKTKLPMRAGIYKITCMITRKVYVGRSVNIQTRRNQHLALLRRDIHYNRYLQSAFKKYGETAFEFEVLELCDDDLEKREEYWIGKTRCAERLFGFNASETADPGHCVAFTKPKEYIVTLLDGSEIVVENLTQFSRKLGFPRPDSDLHKVAAGRQNAFRGYLCRFAHQTAAQWEETRIRADRSGPQGLNAFALTPTGSILPINNLAEFCREHNLSKGTAHGALLGINGRTQHKGFRFSFCRSSLVSTSKKPWTCDP